MGEVWEVSWETGAGDDVYVSRKLFTSEDAARASCPTDGRVEKVKIRDEPLRTEIRYRVYSDTARMYRRSGDTVPTISKPKKFIVNQLQDEYGKPLTWESGWWLDGPTCHSTDRAEALKAVRDRVEPEIKREKDRLAYLARCTHEYVCPDHGKLGMSPPGSHVSCRKCRRWVDQDGNRFGRYETETVSDPEHFCAITSFSFSAGAASPGRDLGPLPDDESVYPKES